MLQKASVWLNTSAALASSEENASATSALISRLCSGELPSLSSLPITLAFMECTILVGVQGSLLKRIV